MPEGDEYFRKPCSAVAPALLVAFLPLALPLSAKLAWAGARMYFSATSSSCASSHTVVDCYLSRLATVHSNADMLCTWHLSLSETLACVLGLTSLVHQLQVGFLEL